MLKSFIFLLRFFLFWLIFFFLERLVFLIYFSEKLKQTPFSETITTFLYGLHLDAAMAGYVSILPLLVFLILWIFPRLRFKTVVPKTYVAVLIILFSLVSVINFNIYREWGSKINSKALDFFFNSTNEAIASSASSPLLLSFFILVLLILTGIVFSRYIISYKIPRLKIPVWQKLIAGIFFLAVNFLAIRGGVDLSPINPSMAYFSSKPILNHAAINTEWNLVYDLLHQNFSTKNPYNYFREEEAEAIVKELYPSEIKEDTTQILNTRQPNVVLILLESFTADLVESLGGEQGVAPNMEKLISEGLFFNQIYASGDRTDKGVIAVLSGFPSQASRSILKFNSKQEKLPSIALALQKNGYHTSFYYGGQSEFFNIKSYVLGHGYKSLIDKKSFKAANLSLWGAFDHFVFEKHVADLGTIPQPFFSTILTLSNHEPFQLPGKAHFVGDSAENKFKSTAYYTDSSLAAYLNTAKTKSWYKNTLFVIVADHGHRLPKGYENYSPGRFRIPLLFFGDALKPEFKGKVIDKIGNQTDIAATLLNQLGISHAQFKWSTNLSNTDTPGFSFYSYDNGFGFVTKEQTISFDNVSRKIIYRKNPDNLKADSTVLRHGKGYMQKVFQTFLDY